MTSNKTVTAACTLGWMPCLSLRTQKLVFALLLFSSAFLGFASTAPSRGESTVRTPCAPTEKWCRPCPCIEASCPSPFQDANKAGCNSEWQPFTGKPETPHKPNPCFRCRFDLQHLSSPNPHRPHPRIGPTPGQMWLNVFGPGCIGARTTTPTPSIASRSIERRTGRIALCARQLE